VKRRVLDVKGLPPIGFGSRDPLWWAMILLAAIEGMMLALAVVTYVYISGRMSPWPPDLSPRWIAWVGVVELVAMLASIVPTVIANKAAVAANIPKMRWGSVISAALGAVALACRIWIMVGLPFRWDADAYGSTVWLLLGIQVIHLGTGIIEDVLVAILLFVGPVEHKHRCDVEASSVLWYFVVVGEIVVFLVVYVDIFRTGWS